MRNRSSVLGLAACVLACASQASAQIRAPLSAPAVSAVPLFAALPAAPAAAPCAFAPAAAMFAAAPSLAPAASAPRAFAAPARAASLRTLSAASGSALEIAARMDAAMDGRGRASAADEGAAPAVKLRREKVLDLQPTQFAAGMRHVADIVEKLKGKSADKADEWLKEHPVPVVLGPNGGIHPIDRHHHARAAWEAGIERVYVEVKADLSTLSEEAFWTRMKENKWVYPFDQFGAGPHDVADLPEDVRGLADDPYRSVAALVREAGGYEKTGTPFADFAWAQFFRRRLKTRPFGDDFKPAVAEALALAKSDAARDLPGWSGRR